MDFAFALEQRHDDGIAFEEDFNGAELCQQLIDRIVKIQAEIGGGVHALFHERASETRRVSHVGFQDHVLRHAILGGLLVLGRQELVEHTVECGKLADFVVADQIDTVKAGGDSFQSAQVAVVAKEVVQKARGEAAAFRTAARGDAFDGGKKPVGIKPALGDDFFHALRLFAENQRVLDLLRVYSRRILAEQRNGFIRGNDMGKNSGALQHAGPDVEPVVPVAILLRQVFAIAGADQSSGVFGNIERLLQMAVVPC